MLRDCQAVLPCNLHSLWNPRCWDLCFFHGPYTDSFTVSMVSPESDVGRHLALLINYKNLLVFYFWHCKITTHTQAHTHVHTQ